MVRGVVLVSVEQWTTRGDVVVQVLVLWGELQPMDVWLGEMLGGQDLVSGGTLNGVLGSTSLYYIQRTLSRGGRKGQGGREIGRSTSPEGSVETVVEGCGGCGGVFHVFFIMTRGGSKLYTVRDNCSF